MQAKVLQALETAGVFTSGGLVKDKVPNPIKLSQKIITRKFSGNLVQPNKTMSRLSQYCDMKNMQVLFCSTEMGRSSFVRQLEPDWHIDTNPEISTQLAVKSFPRLFIYILVHIFSSVDLSLSIYMLCLIAEVHKISASRL